MNKSIILQKIRHNAFFAKLDDIVGLSKFAKKRNNRKISNELRLKHYNVNENVSGAIHACVAMFDGRVNQGGLCDRLWGAVSTYLYCKDNRIPFKLHFVSPFQLTDYLMPASVDWTVKASNLCFDGNVSKPLVIKCLGFGREDDMSVIGKEFSRDIKQVHVYTNAHGFRSRFHEGFRDLFQPSNILASAINDVLASNGDDYVSISFRFVRLFGDFEDINWPMLPDEKSREDMIQRGLAVIERVKSMHPGKKVLVTTDSITFLNRAKVLDNVFVVEGDIKHVDFSDVGSEELPHLKTFLDLLLISRAKHVYLGVNDMVYRSTFAKTASQIGNCPFDMLDF